MASFSISSVQSGDSLQASSGYSFYDFSSSATSSLNHNLATFLIVANWYEVDYFQSFNWDFLVENAAPSSTARIFESAIDVKNSFVFKRIRNLSSGDTQDNERQTYNALVTEISSLRHPFFRRHPFVIKLEAISWEIDGDSVWPILVLEKAQHGDLDYFMSTDVGKSLSIEHKIRVCADIATVLNALHAWGIVHGDIKPQNFFMFEDPHRQVFSKIADFGHSFISDKHSNGALFKPAKSWPWYAPEYHHRGFSMEQGKKQDVYSFGMLCFWLIFHTELYTAAQKSSHSECTTETSTPSREAVYALLESWKLRGTLQGVALEMIGNQFSKIQQEVLTAVFNASLTADPNAREGDFEKICSLLRSCDPTRKLYQSSLTDIQIPSLDNMFAESFQQGPLVKSFWQFMQVDYKIRTRIVLGLEQYLNYISPNHSHYRTTVSQLAFCYHLGFGTPRDEPKVNLLLEGSQELFRVLFNQIEILRNDFTPPNFMNETLQMLMSEGYLSQQRGLLVAGRSRLRELEMEARTREVIDIASVLGESHLAVYQVRHNLTEWLDGVGFLDEAEAEILKMLQSLFNMDDQEVTEVASNTTDHHGAQKKLLTPSEMPEGAARSSILHLVRTAPDQLDISKTRVLDDLTRIYMRQGRWVEAEYPCVQVGLFFRQLDHQPYLQLLNNSFKLGLIYEYQGRSLEAVKLYKDLTETCTERLGQEHWLTVQVNLASLRVFQSENHHWQDLTSLIEYILSVFLRKARNNDAQRFNWLSGSSPEDQFLEVTKRMADWGHLNMDTNTRQILVCMNALAYMHTKRKKYDQARCIRQQMVNISRKCLPVDHPRTLEHQKRLAMIWYEEGRMSEAERDLDEVFKKCTHTLGEDHEVTLGAATDLSLVYYTQNRLAEAELLLQKTNERAKSIHGLNHPRTLAGSMNLAAFYIMSRDPVKRKSAAALLEDTLARQKHVLGDHHEHVFQCVEHLGRLYGEDGRYDEAESLYRFLVTRRESLLGPDHPDVFQSKHKLVACLSFLDREPEATAIVKDLCAAQARIHGESSEQAIESLAYLVHAYFREERWEEWIMLNQNIVENGGRVLGHDHPSVRAAAARIQFRNEEKNWPPKFRYIGFSERRDSNAV